MNARDHWLRVKVAGICALLLTCWTEPADSRQLVYVADSSSNQVLVIDTQTNTIVASIPVGSQPVGVAVSPNGQSLYVANRVAGTFSVIDTNTNQPIALVAGLNLPLGLAATPDGRRVYVTNSGSHTVSAIDTKTNNVIGTINVGLQPTGIAITPDGQRAYVTNFGSSSVSAIDLASNMVLTIQVGNGPLGIAVTPDGGRVYVVNGGTVSVIETATNTVEPGVTLVDTFYPTGHPNIPSSSIAITPDGARAYLPIQGSFSGFGLVSVVTTADNTPVIVLAVAPFLQQVFFTGAGGGIAITGDGKRAYLSSYGGTDPGKIIVVDIRTHTTLATIATEGPAPAGIAVTPGDQGREELAPK